MARSAYKLKEIHEKQNILPRGGHILDLGYYPGSWVQYVISQVGPSGSVVGVDLNPPQQGLVGPQVALYKRDIHTLRALGDLKREAKFDCILSDMAPKATGVRFVDQARALELLQWPFERASGFLKEGGHLVAKIFDSQEARTFVRSQKNRFQNTSFLRPKSTRRGSFEHYVICKHFLPTGPL